jgi:hypothetical protein
VKQFALIICALALTACTSQPKVQHSQFCHTNQTIVTRNGEKVDSTTELKCSDDPVERMMEKRAGVAQNCGEFIQRYNLGGRIVSERAISCQRIDGSWFVLPVVR